MHRQATWCLAIALAANTLLSLFANTSFVRLPDTPTKLEITLFCLVGTALAFVLDRLIVYPRLRSEMRDKFSAVLVCRERVASAFDLILTLL
jgi:hypothetical protein